MDSGCTNYIYDEDYLSFLVRYDGDINGVYEKFDPVCVSIINNQFLVAYSKPNVVNIEEMVRYGYESLPKCYGLTDDQVNEAIGVESLRLLPGLGLDGKDVIIGFVDTGIDISAESFKKPDGSTRILSIWDQNEAAYNGQDAMYGYGRVFNEAYINNVLQNPEGNSFLSYDDNGHGSFLASIAAGISGVAPGADIIMVKLKPAKRALRRFNVISDEAGCYSEEDIMFGVKYLVAEAARLGKPLVICLGLGTNQGGHDGNSALETYLNSLLGLRGISVVVSGGNETGFGGHFGLNGIDGTKADVEIAVGSNDNGFIMEIWGSAPGLLEVNVISPTGEVFDEIPSIRNGGVKKIFLYEGTSVYAENVVVDKVSGDPFCLLRFLNPTEGIWTVRVNARGSISSNGFNAWLPIHNFLNSDTSFVAPLASETICAPGNARGPITVAGYDYRTGAIYVNSSRGFTRTGGIKPDITAPAVDVAGAFARSSGFSETSLYTRKSGTSIAAAIVAGAAALLLQWGIVNRNAFSITNEDIKQILIRGANREGSISYPSPIWGYGTLDVYGAFNTLRQ